MAFVKLLIKLLIASIAMTISSLIFSLEIIMICSTSNRFIVKKRIFFFYILKRTYFQNFAIIFHCKIKTMSMIESIRIIHNDTIIVIYWSMTDITADCHYITFFHLRLFVLDIVKHFTNYNLFTFYHINCYKHVNTL